MSPSLHPLDDKLLLGRYRVMRLLGEGGMGTVHLARVEGAEGFTRPVVVKRMKRDIRASEEGNRLFVREAKILSKLQHPGIVGIIDFGIEDGAHIMVLEYVHGYTLSPWLEYRRKRKLPLPVDVCLYVVRRILDALYYAHHFDTEEGREIEIVHRDVSPDNVLLSNKGYVHLLDFGIASMRGPEGHGSTKSGAFRGKLCYAAPETVEGEPATPRSDQYSAAVMLLELLTGTTPFVADSVVESFRRMVYEVPDPASKFRDDIPEALDQALARALAKDPAERFESALAFSRELRGFQTDADEDIAQLLKQLVSQEFELLPEAVGVEALKDREAALQRILSVAPPSATPGLGELPTVAGLGELSPSQPALPTRLLSESKTDSSGKTPVAPSPLRGLLWGLLVVGGLIAVGLGAAIALLSRGGSADQVVVVGGETPQQALSAGNALSDLSVATGSEPAVNVATNAQVSPHSVNDPGAGQPANGMRPAPTGTPAPPVGSAISPTRNVAPASATKGSRQQQLSRAVQQQSAAYQSCFASHLDDTKQHPEAVLHFSVASQGGAAQVKIEPLALATTALGTCLKAAASRVQFPQLREAVAFRVPVRARVSHSKGTE